jgi:polyisoprenoid-binding protein YceI
MTDFTYQGGNLMCKRLVIVAMAVLLSGVPAFAATYNIDPVHSQIHFTVAHLVMFKVKGAFDQYQGVIEAEPGSGTLGSVRATIRTASIDTREKKRDDHLRSADFFDAANHPEMTFVSKRVEGNGGEITVIGDLTIRGTTREVALKGKHLGEIKDAYGMTRAGFEAAGKINRQDFGLAWNKALEAGGMVVGDEVVIGLEIQAVKQ